MPTYPVTIGEWAPGSDDPLVQRFKAGGQAVTVAQITLDPNWDSDASVTVDAGSTDQAGIVRVTAGTTPAGTPFWKLDYSLTFGSAPMPIVMKEGAGTQPNSSSTATQLTVTQTGVIAAHTTIVYHYHVI